MPTAFSPRGNAISSLFKDETSFGVLPTGNYTPTLFYSHSLEEKQPYQDDNLLGQTQNNNRDVNSPEPGLPVLTGDVDFPLDLAHMGDWLKMVFGAPASSGVSPNFIHVFNSGGEVLPHRTLECKLNAALFYNYTGLLAQKLSFALGMTAGYEHFTLSLLGRKENKTTSTVGGSPAALKARVPVIKAIPVCKIDSTILGSVISVKADYDNGAVPQNFIGDQYPQGHDLDNLAKFAGSISMRFRDSTVYDMAKAQGLHSLELLWQNNANASLSLLAANTRLEPAGVPIKGPGGIDATFNFRSEQSASNPMMVATLKSPTATF